MARLFWYPLFAACFAGFVAGSHEDARIFVIGFAFIGLVAAIAEIIFDRLHPPPKF